MPKTKHTVEQLMKLLGHLTGWSDQSLSVDIGYKRMRVYDGYGDSDLIDKWGFVVGTTLCGTTNHDGKSVAVHAQAEELNDALWALCEEVMKKWASIASKALEWDQDARKRMTQFLEAEKLDIQIDTSRGPYR